MPKYLDLTGLTTLKSKLDERYANKNDVYDKTAADNLLSAKANSADVYTKAQVDSAIAGAGGLPTITIALSQVISQSPLQIQLTDEQYATMNGHSVILDVTALGMPVVVADYNGDGYTDNNITYMQFIFIYGNGNFVNFNSISVNVSTKVAELSETYPYQAQEAYYAEQSARTSAVSYATIAPSSANTEGLKIVVLSSEPATRYEGYLYIITGE